MKKKISVSSYRRQAEANTLDFFGTYFEKRRLVFCKLTTKFTENKVNWALGCSCNLFFRGIVDDFNDFDFIVEQESIEIIQAVMKSLDAVLIATGGNGFCESDIYLHYILDGCDVDIISGFRLNTFGTSFYYRYSNVEVELVDLDYIKVPLISAEALFILYGMMEGWQTRRRFKRELLFEYLKKTGVYYPKILERSISRYNLPPWLTELLKSLL